jgi:hypothetical protein
MEKVSEEKAGEQRAPCGRLIVWPQATVADVGAVRQTSKHQRLGHQQPDE